MNKENVTVVVLASRLVNRMNSRKSKLMMNLCGKPMAQFAIGAAQAVSASKPVIVVGEDAGELQEAFADTVLYAQRSGEELLPQVCLSGGRITIVFSADMPFVSKKMLTEMLETLETRDVGACIAIGGDETAQSGSVYCFDTAILAEAMGAGVQTFSECVEYFADNGHGVEPIYSSDCDIAVDRIQLAKISDKMRARINNDLMRGGVTMIDPQSTYIDAGVKIGMDTTIYPGVIIEGDSEIGQDVILYQGSRIVDSNIGNGSVVQNSVLLEAVVGENSTIGPYAYLRPNTVVGNGCRVGDFVEVKNATILEGAKVSHLSYIGDATIGARSNIGAGTITCNYDGFMKHHTEIGEGAFIGSNTMLVAPVKIGVEAMTASGSVINKDVPDGALALARARQETKLGMALKLFDKLKKTKAKRAKEAK